MRKTIIRHIRRILPGVLLGGALLSVSGTAHAYEPRIHCKEDTVKISKLLIKTAERGGTLGDRIVFVANELVGTPWSSPLDNDSIGTIVISMHGFDRMGFLNTVLALAEASRQTLPRIQEYERLYESFSRRKGEDDGFLSS